MIAPARANAAPEPTGRLDNFRMRTPILFATDAFRCEDTLSRQSLVRTSANIVPIFGIIPGSPGKISHYRCRSGIGRDKQSCSTFLGKDDEGRIGLRNRTQKFGADKYRGVERRSGTGWSGTGWF